MGVRGELFIIIVGVEGVILHISIWVLKGVEAGDLWEVDITNFQTFEKFAVMSSKGETEVFTYLWSTDLNHLMSS